MKYFIQIIVQNLISLWMTIRTNVIDILLKLKVCYKKKNLPYTKFIFYFVILNHEI